MNLPQDVMIRLQPDAEGRIHLMIIRPTPEGEETLFGMEVEQHQLMWRHLAAMSDGVDFIACLLDPIAFQATLPVRQDAARKQAMKELQNGSAQAPSTRSKH